MSRSEELFAKAVNLIPGGVNSPVRAFGSVGETPRFIDSADGAYMTDVDVNRYLDFISSWGPMILGQNHPAIKESVIKACEKGLSFGAATEKDGNGRIDLQHRSFCGNGADGEFRNRGSDECSPGSKGLYWKR